MPKDISLEDITGLLEQLISFETESRTPNLELIDLYSSRVASAGGSVDVVPGPEGRANLLARFGPATSGGIMLSGHTDVVPAGSGWDTNPYELAVVDGQLRGRGTADMKGFLATAMVVMDSINVDVLRAPVYLALSYDEEIGCVGVRGLLNKLVADGSCEPDVVVVGEPTSMQVRTAHSGKVAYELLATAQAGHSSRSKTDPTAIGEMVRIGTAIGELNHPEGAVSANVGTIEGGIAVNVLSPRCTMDFELRHDANTTPRTVLEPIWKTTNEARDRLATVEGGIEIAELINYPALDTSVDHASVRVVAEAAGVEPGGRVDYGCEAGLFTASLGAPAVIAGPGDIANAHRPDEYVYPAELEACAGFLQRLVAPGS